jgi:hypothetical protein
MIQLVFKISRLKRFLGDSLAIDDHVDFSAIAARVIAIGSVWTDRDPPLLPIPHAGAGPPH